jgi:hypothetical protein
MPPQINPLEMLYAEMSAIQIVVQRLLGQMAINSGHDPQKVLDAEHEEASGDLARTDFGPAPPDRLEVIRAHAQSILDGIYVMASTSRKSGPEPP